MKDLQRINKLLRGKIGWNLRRIPTPFVASLILLLVCSLSQSESLLSTILGHNIVAKLQYITRKLKIPPSPLYQCS